MSPFNPLSDRTYSIRYRANHGQWKYRLRNCLTQPLFDNMTRLSNGPTPKFLAHGCSPKMSRRYSLQILISFPGLFRPLSQRSGGLPDAHYRTQFTIRQPRKLPQLNGPLLLSGATLYLAHPRLASPECCGGKLKPSILLRVSSSMFPPLSQPAPEASILRKLRSRLLSCHHYSYRLLRRHPPSRRWFAGRCSDAVLPHRCGRGVSRLSASVSWEWSRGVQPTAQATVAIFSMLSGLEAYPSSFRPDHTALRPMSHSGATPPTPSRPKELRRCAQILVALSRTS